MERVEVACRQHRYAEVDRQTLLTLPLRTWTCLYQKNALRLTLDRLDSCPGARRLLHADEDACG